MELQHYSSFNIMKKFIFTILASSAPFLALAAAPTDFKSVIELFLKIIQNFIAILFVSLTVGILYGVVLFMINSDNEKKREEIKGYLLYGVTAAVVTLGLWGFIEILNSTIFGGAIGIPQLSPPS